MNQNNLMSNVPSSVYSHVSQLCGCAAPFSQMLIAWGHVCVCCYQDRVSLGNLKEERLKDIWNGKNFKALRRKLIQGHSLGYVDSTWAIEAETGRSVCHYCSTFNNNSLWKPNVARSEGVYNRYFSIESPPKTETIQRLPCYIEFKYSMLCNLECPMCIDWWKARPRRWNPQGVPYHRIKPIYDDTYWTDLRPFLKTAETVCFLGGEPLIQQEVWKTLNILKDINPQCEVRIVSNLVKWTPKVEQRLSAHGNISITLSIESSDPGLYGFFRAPNTLEKLQKKLDRLNSWRIERLYAARSNIKLTSIVTITALNLNTLVQTIYWLKRNAVSTIHFDIAFTPRWRFKHGVSYDLNIPEKDAIPISPELLSKDRIGKSCGNLRRQISKLKDKEVVDRLGFCRRLFDPVTLARFESAIDRLETCL